MTEQKYWWVYLVRGIATILFGVMMLAWPFTSIFVIAILFASLLIVYGLADIINGFITHNTTGVSQVARIILGILETGTGAYLLAKAGTGLTLEFIGLLAGINLVILAIVTGAIAIMGDNSISHRWLALIAAVFALFIGVVIAANPAISAATLIWTFGVFGLFYGPLEIAASFMLKDQKN